MMELHPDFKEFLRSLTAHRVRFVIVGAHALAAHGRPRYTGDLDVLVEPSRTNAARLLAALADFGFGTLGLTIADFVRAGTVVRLGRPPVCIDILTSISGVRFGEAWKGRLRARIAGMTVSFLGHTQFVRNKRAAARPKDLADLALLDEAATPATTRRKPRRR